MDRRAFITLTAVSGTSAALASCGSPERQLVRFVPDEELTPGVAQWKPSVCPLCRGGCGMSVRVMDADVDVVRNGQRGVVRMGVAKKLEGQAAHPINRGGLCARGQAAIQITYHPDRLRHPMKRSGSRGSGQFDQVTWDQAIGELIARLDALQSRQGQSSLAFLTRPRGTERYALIEQFLARFGAPPPIPVELFGDAVLRRANHLSFGHEQLPTFDLARAQYVVGFGADFLGTWNSPVAQAMAYGEMRQGRPGVRGSFVQVEARMTQTGANADEWVPVRPATEGMLALGLAHVIIRDELRPRDAAGRAGLLVDGWSGGLADYAPDRVERVTGIDARRVERLAREFATRRPSVAIVGGPPLAHTTGLFTALAVNALNALVGSVEAPGGVFFTPAPPGARPRTSAAGQSGSGRQARADQPHEIRAHSIDRLAADILAGSPIDLLLVDEVDPVYSTPPAWKVRDALGKIPFIVSFGSFLDDTSALADLILPDHSFLESWVASQPESGSRQAVLNVAPPVMKPLHDTRAMPDVLLEISRRLKEPLDLPWETYDAMLSKRFAALPPAPDGSDAWTTAQEQGGWWGAPVKSAAGVAPFGDERPPRPVRFDEPQFDGDAQQYPLHFLPYASSAFLDGSLAHLPWLQEMPDPLTSAMWSSWIEINPKTAERLGVRQGDVVEVRSQHGTLHVPAFVSPAIAPDIVAMPAGQGHRTFTRFASGRGANPIAILAPVVEPETGALAWAATRVRVTRVGGSGGQLTLFAGELRDRPHQREVR